MKNLKLFPVNSLALIAIMFSPTYFAMADINDDISQLQRRWAEINYELEGKVQLQAFEQLIDEAESLTANNSQTADAWIWSGIIKSTYAGARGGLGALSFAKQSKADLEKAITIDGSAMNGSAYTSLGTLYFSVPGWPIGFGNDKKAEELLLKALSLNPDGIDSNYFYGSYLINEKRYDEARTYLTKARHAPARVNRPIADSGRKKEIGQALLEIEGK